MPTVASGSTPRDRSSFRPQDEVFDPLSHEIHRNTVINCAVPIGD